MSMLTADEAAARLGVKLDTVYAYVSRGVLSARREPGSRRSVFDGEEVDAVARRGRPRRSTRPPVLDLVVETGLTTIIDQQIRYRGRDAWAMAQSKTFEQVANWLWTGTEEEPGLTWGAPPMSLPGLEDPRDRIRAAVIVASSAQPTRLDLSTPAVVASARALIASMVSAVVVDPETVAAPLMLGDGLPPVRGSIAGRLWSGLTARRPARGLVAALNAALVLLADHELATSTVAARVAASVRADPFSVVLAGLGPLAGRLHGSASALVHRMIADAMASGPDAALATALRTHGHLPGFGHRLYPDGDPRAAVLLAMIDAAAPSAPSLPAIHALVDSARRHSRTEPNIDYALAALSTVARMPASAGEAIFTVARSAGWVAHAIEEYTEPPLRFRARAIPRKPRVTRSDVRAGTLNRDLDDNQY